MSLPEADYLTSRFCSNLAKKHSIFLVAGSIPEKSITPVPGVDFKHSNLLPGPSTSSSSEPISHYLFNTSIVYDPNGNVVAKHRKIHLFDINIPGRMVFRESDTLTPGIPNINCGSYFKDSIFDTPFGRMGLGICYDVRFPNYSQILADMGATCIIFPAAFNTTTGPLHWELLLRGRAVDQQCFVVACSPARTVLTPEQETSATKPYQAWGHSSVISPWGKVIATCEHQPELIMAELDFKEVTQMRESIPVRSQRRTDLYQVYTSTN
jgi:omega-amidase